MTMTKIVDEKQYVGGFSEGIAESYKFKEYVGGGYVAGYFGHEQRNKKRDKLVEQILRERGLGNEGISTWLTSTSARHMMDGVSRKDNIEIVEKKVRVYTMNAFLDVVIWSMPDHDGTLGSTNELRNKLCEKTLAYTQGLASQYV